MTKEDYLDDTGDLMADRKGKYDIESIWYFIPEVTGLDAGWDDEVIAHRENRLCEDCDEE